MRLLLFSLFLFLSLFACTSNTQYLSREQQDSVEVAIIREFKTKNEQNTKGFAENIAKILDFTQNLTIQSLDSNKKIRLNIPYCSFLDSCKYELADLTLVLPSYRLKGEELKFHTYFTPYQFLSALNTFSALESNAYKATRFQDSSWEYVQKNLYKDLYNVQILWQPKWVLILDLKQMQAPTSEFGGGKIVGLWHLFDFQSTQYQGSVSVAAENTPNFRPPTTRQKEVTEEKNTRRYNSKYSTTERTTVKRLEIEYLNDAQRYYYASKNLEENFKEKSMKALNQYFTNPKGKNIIW